MSGATTQYRSFDPGVQADHGPPGPAVDVVHDRVLGALCVLRHTLGLVLYVVAQFYSGDAGKATPAVYGAYRAGVRRGAVRWLRG
jgi:hypothetical protein